MSNTTVPMQRIFSGALMFAMAFAFFAAFDARAATPASNAEYQTTTNAADPSMSNDNALPRRRDQRNPDDRGVAWSQLSSEQRQVLKPLRSQWSGMPVKRRQHLAQRAQEWAELPPRRRAAIRDRIQRWAGMDGEQRQQAVRGANQFRDLPEADRKRLMDTWRRFQSLPPAQRRELMQRWREQRKDRNERRDQSPDRTAPAPSRDNER